MSSPQVPASPRPKQPSPRIRRRLELQGRVQGVGFRPFAWRLAQQLGLEGVVGNSPQGAFVEVQGPAPAVEIFAERLTQELPEPGHVEHVEACNLPLLDVHGFRILPSEQAGEQVAEILPDLDVCPDCLHELFDPGDRRFRYPFLNCTHCGPRYSVVLGLPYDRANTTLRRFPLCPKCQAEYDDPADRRFHAQPVACPDCGPRLWYCGPDGVEQKGDAIALAAKALRDGAIVAVKGLGGFHLACRADDEGVVRRLRQRKGREAKPLAVMVADLQMARRYIQSDAAIDAALSSHARPIVLAPKLAGAGLAEEVAPDAGRWGLMLPNTPLHHLLLGSVGLPLVLTSGNPSGEPLCSDNDEALRRLAPLADAFLLHDRDIARRVDDSVCVAVDPGDGLSHLLPLRRARGYTPTPVRLAFRSAKSILALGGEMKSAVCLLKGQQAVLSEHLGELDNPEAYRNFLGAGERLQALLKAKPERLAADLHPLYAATRWAKAQDLPLTLVQHHHAHIVSCMAEHGLRGPVVGIACDGTGYGSDGSIWGGEILVCDEAAFRRAAHLAPYALLGGDAAAQEPWRPALGLLASAWPDDWQRRLGPLQRLAGGGAIDLAAKRLNAGQGIVRTSSLGRLFDGVAALLGYCERNRYEAEAAMLLQHAAESAGEVSALPYGLREPLVPGDPFLLDTAPMLRALFSLPSEPARLARGFHEGIAGLFADGARRVAEQCGLQRVVLSGGCFANGLLLQRMATRLRLAGFDVYLHRQVPCGDGGLALGQAVVAAQASIINED